MKASEILNRYATGERDFRRTDLRGQSFKGQDLSGANFSKADIRGVDFSKCLLTGVNFTQADIRGTSFTDSTLENANFKEAKAGLLKKSLILLVSVSVLIFGLPAFVAGIGGLVLGIFTPINSIRFYLILGSLLLAILASLFVKAEKEAYLKAKDVWGQTYTKPTVLLVQISFILGYISIISFVSSMLFIILRSDIWVVSLVLLGLISIGLAISIAFAMAGVGVPALVAALILVLVGTLSLIGSVGAILIHSGYLDVERVIILIGLSSIFASLIAEYLAFKAFSATEQMIRLRLIVVNFAALGGTSFRRSNLTNANFYQATLRGADFREAKLLHAYFRDSKALHQSRQENPDYSPLSNPLARQLLVDGEGRGKSYVGVSFKDMNLTGVDLTEANLTEADFSGATLESARLERSNLTKARALGTDFRLALLTKACLENWNIDSATQLEGIICDCVYLEGNQQERRPSSGDFAPGEFTKLFQEVLSTVDLIFRNGIDWKAFTYSFNKLVLDNEGTELSIQSIENKGDGVMVVRVNAPPDADKATLHGEFNQTYETAVKALEAKYYAELNAKDEQITIYRQQSADMLEITRLMANRPVSIINENTLMNNSSDQSRNINVTGNVTGFTFNLGEISGSITNTINQLQAANPQAAELADRLRELQGAIETEPDLQPDDKTEALEQVGTLAKAGENPQDGTLKKLAGTSIKVLKGTIAALPSTATIVKACSDLLPVIIKLLGL